MKILIVEDEKELAQDIVKYLSGQNYVCEVAENYNQATDKIAVYQYDCILLDLMLPDGNGLALLEQLKRENKQDGVIIISAKNSIEDKVMGLQNGADDYLAKPFHHSELSARIHSIILRKQFNNASVIEQHEIRVDLLGKNVWINEIVINLTKK